MPDPQHATSPAVTTGRACRHWADGHCGATDGVRLYVVGLRCESHSPAALAGRPEATGQYCAPGRHYCVAAGTPCPTAPAAAEATARPAAWRLLVTGAREHPDKPLIWGTLDSYHGAHPDLVVVHGKCYPREKGGRRPDVSADWLAHLWCLDRGVPDEPHPADWDRYGDSAGPIRNQEMVDLGADECAGFPLGASPGTYGCMRKARKAGIPVRRWPA